MDTSKRVEIPGEADLLERLGQLPIGGVLQAGDLSRAQRAALRKRARSRGIHVRGAPGQRGALERVDEDQAPVEASGVVIAPADRGRRGRRRLYAYGHAHLAELSRRTAGHVARVSTGRWCPPQGAGLELPETAVAWVLAVRGHRVLADLVLYALEQDTRYSGREDAALLEILDSLGPLAAAVDQ